ncbi:MAG TPA: thioredoxin family protein [Flavobacteriaceae bacterium]|nr:thioredoxin family protein [Flavobacteriaceae bacterium]
MRKIVLLLIITFFQLNTINAQKETSDPLNWISNFETAKEIAKTENKPILIFFTGSDWCGICKMLDKDFLSSDKFKKLANEKLVLYKADFPRRTDIVSAEQKQVNIILDKKYSKSRNKRSFPTIVLINANGIELGYIESYNYIHDTTKHYGLIESILTQY